MAGEGAVRGAGAVLGAVVAVLVAAGPVTAVPQGGVSLPVVPARLADGAACTGASKSVAAAMPWEQGALGLDLVRRAGDGAGVLVAVVDTGVSTAAPALKGRVTAVGGAGHDCVGHGTFAAGIVAAAPTAGVRFAGVVPGARVLAVRGTDERGAATAASVAAGIRAAARAGAKVIEVSLALEGSSAALASAVAEAGRHDALVVAAAAPDPTASGAGSTPAAPRAYYPAALPAVLSVVDDDAALARPRGAVVPLSADLAAPGDGVVGVGPAGKGHYLGSGASFAAAYVAGTAALVRSLHPELSAAQTAARLTATAYPDDIPRLDPYAAVNAVRPRAAGAPTAPAAPAVVLSTDPGPARAAHRAELLAGLALALVLATAWIAATFPRARARTRLRRMPPVA
ncbi:S8 family serine peptidase [Streptomyces polygonati]|uniref:S8 family serine peptidase n=1 Tax=Streptomyces polygonati TaxID=1617087 RepID=A0ABV8HTT2_9ACTN